MPQRVIALTQALSVAELPGGGGVTLVPRPTPLTRLHYYNGKFLRASDLELEQRYLQQLVAFANQAGGAGVVHGYNAVWPGGDRLELGPGLALDPQGRTLLLLEPAVLSIAELIAASRGAGAVALTPSGPRRIGRPVFSDCEPLAADDGGTFADGGALYAVTLCHAEALCGTEDVLGRLCAEACATSTERPYILEGVLVRAVPLRLETPLATSAAVALTGKHLRSLVASAYFADEWRRGGSLISAAGLAADAWCLGTAAQGGACVPIGLVARAGDATLFFDAWTLRRERIEPPPRRYWAGRMAMRPWDVFLAQVLQFQCQLTHCLGDHPAPEDDPCRPAFDLLRQSSEELARWLGDAAAKRSGAEGARFEILANLRGRLADAAATFTAAPAARILLGCGITELPAAGYLPVVPSANLTVNEQVRRLMGEGVDLRFCVVHPDFVAHALEEAQHMERISLLAGLDDPARKPQVDVLVPDGEIDTSAIQAPGQGYEIEFTINSLAEGFEGLVSGETTLTAVQPGDSVVGRPQAAATQDKLIFSGAGRGEDLAAGGLAFHLAGRERTAVGRIDLPAGRDVTVDPVFGLPQAAVWLTVAIDRDPFALQLHERGGASAEIVLTHVTTGGDGNLETRTLELDFHGEIGVVDRGMAQAGGPRLTAQAVGRLVVTGRGSGGDIVSRSLRVQEDVSFERTSSTGGGDTVSVLLPHFRFFQPAAREFAVLVRRQWPAASQARVEGTAALAGQDILTTAAATNQTVPLFQLLETENADVARADHPAHEAAIAALQRLGQALADTDFADSRARRLFPPPAPAQAELRVRATRDWVLFHRRRTKVCGIDVPPPQVVPRRYRLFHLPLPSLQARDALRRVLQTGGELVNFNPRPAGTVEFAGGLASVQTAPQIVRNAWDAVVPDGVQIVLGAIASQGDALTDGTTLAGARLDSLAGVLAPVTARTPDASFEVLDNLPPDLPAVGLDGVVLYATVAPAVATTCNEIYLNFDSTVRSREAAEELANRLAANPNDPFGDEKRLRLLGRPKFQDNTAQFAPGEVDALKEAWRKVVGREPSLDILGVAIAISPAGSSADESALHRQQSANILQALVGETDVIAQTHVSSPLPNVDCPAVTIIVGLDTTF